MAEVGRPTDLTDELTLEIRKLVLDGQSYVNIQAILEIPAGTWDYWVYKNLRDFRTNLTNWKHERIIKSAESVLESSMTEDDKRVRLDAAKFALERLNKKEYSVKTETDITTAGKPINVIVPQELADKNNISVTDTGTEENSSEQKAV